MTTEATETTNDSASTPEAGDAAVLAAAREAMGKPAVEAEAAEGIAAGVPSTEPATPIAAEVSELQQLRESIKAKERDQRLREEVTASLRKEHAAELAAAREQLAKEVRAEHAAAFKSRMRTQPVETLTEYEVEGVDLVRRIAERAGPQGQSLTELAQLREELAALKGGGGAVPKEISEALAEMKAWKEERARDAQARQQAAVENAQRQLVTMVTEKSAGAVAFYGGERAMVARAHEIADEYCQAKGVTTCPYPIIVQELDAEARKGAADSVRALEARLAALKALQQPAAVTVAPTESNGRKTTQVPRTPSAAGASERRASPKPASEMSASELDEAARVAAREAMGPKQKSRMA
jgi:hypothetical protein